MAYIFLVYCCILSNVGGSNLVHYKFGSNFGQIFYDYSGNGNHGQNGDSTDQDEKDTIPDSRGAYFKDNNRFIRLPYNSIKDEALSLGSQFSILMWFYHSDVEPYNTFLIKRANQNHTNSFTVVREISLDSYYLSYDFTNYKFNANSGNGLFPLGKKYLGQWIFVAIINDLKNFKYYSNGNQVLTFTQDYNYSEDTPHYHYIGWHGSSFLGFFWNYLVYNETITISNFYSSSYLTVISLNAHYLAIQTLAMA